jgi:large subunit ribosomal protein L9
VLRQVEHRRAKEAERQAALRQAAIDFRTALATIGRFTVKKQTGGDDVLFGTVTNGDVAEAIEAATKKDVDRRDILVPDIHRTGSYKVQVKLHPEVVAEINLEVVSY